MMSPSCTMYSLPSMPILLAALRLTAESDVVLVFDYLGADESLFKIGMDYAGALRSLAAFVIGPRLDLKRSGGEIGLKVEQVEG